MAAAVRATAQHAAEAAEKKARATAVAALKRHSSAETFDEPSAQTDDALQQNQSTREEEIEKMHFNHRLSIMHRHLAWQTIYWILDQQLRGGGQNDNSSSDIGVKYR